MRLLQRFQEGERKEDPRLDIHICCRLRNEIEDRDEMAVNIIILFTHRLIDSNKIMISYIFLGGGGNMEAILTLATYQKKEEKNRMGHIDPYSFC